MCQNWDIGQDSKGVIYVANRNGLVCYDGKTWQTYTTNENRTIRSLYISPNDRIYIGRIGADATNALTGLGVC